MFTRTTLRTTDAASARSFYRAVLGHARAARAEILPLHEQALRRGARPHWLGIIGVEDVEATAARLLAHGGERLGPAAKTPDGFAFATLRDCGGALLGLSSRPVPSGPLEVAWHELNSSDLAASLRAYPEVFGWRLTGTVEVGFTLHKFAFREGLAEAGSMAAIAGRPGVHPQWLFHFRVDDLDASAAATRAGGGTIAAVIALPNGERVAVCDDPQGAAFALRGA